MLDVQLAEVAARQQINGPTHRLKGLGACLDTYLPSTSTQKTSELKVSVVSSRCVRACACAVRRGAPPLALRFPTAARSPSTPERACSIHTHSRSD